MNPDTFNDDNNVALLFNVVKPETFNDDNNVALLFNVVKPETFKLVIFNDEKAVEPFIYPNILVVVLFKLLIDNVDALDKLFILSLFWLNEIFKAVISIGAGGEPLSPPVKKSSTLLKPRNNTIAATPSFALTANAPTPSIAKSCKTNLPRSIIACLCKDSISSWTIQNPGNLLGKRILGGW